jgi:hypothetical protein
LPQALPVQRVERRLGPALVDPLSGHRLKWYRLSLSLGQSAAHVPLITPSG